MKSTNVSVLSSFSHSCKIHKLLIWSQIAMYSNVKRSKDMSGSPRKAGIPQVLGEIVFGIHPVKLALQAKRRQPYKLYVKKDTNTEGFKEIKQLCSEAGVKVRELQKNYMNALSDHRPHQGVCLDASKLETDFVSLQEDDVRNYMTNEEKHPSLWLLPYSVKDPMNMGSILRSSYFFGVDCVLLPQHDSCPLTPMVSKASSGVAEIINIKTIASNQSIQKFIQLWALNGGNIIGTSCDTSDNRLRSLDSIEFDKPALLVLGNEGEGVPVEILDQCNINIHIKPHNTQHLDSLNVSVATGVILHCLANLRQKFIQNAR